MDKLFRAWSITLIKLTYFQIQMENTDAGDFGPEMPPMDDDGNMIKEKKIIAGKVDDKD